jgi:hypothetical protein
VSYLKKINNSIRIGLYLLLSRLNNIPIVGWFIIIGILLYIIFSLLGQAFNFYDDYPGKHLLR